MRVKQIDLVGAWPRAWQAARMRMKSLLVPLALASMGIPISAEEGRDGALREFGIYAESAASPTVGEARETVLPLKLEPGARIAYVGNTLLDRAQHFAYFESLLMQRYPQHDLFIRNFAWSADEVDLQPRPDNFATVPQHLTREKIDVVFAAFGFNESFGGVEKLGDFRKRLSRWVRATKTSAYDGKQGPLLVLLSPIANEDLPNNSAAKRNQAQLEAYTQVMREVAAAEKVGFADLFSDTKALFERDDETTWTINGVHLTGAGYEKVAGILYREVFGESAPQVKEELRKVLVDKESAVLPALPTAEYLLLHRGAEPNVTAILISFRPCGTSRFSRQTAMLALGPWSKERRHRKR